MAKKANHYVDNELFLEALKRYIPIVRPLYAQHKKECMKLLKAGVKKKNLPKFPYPQTIDYDYIGTCLLKIAEHLAYKHRFINYTFRDEMIGDAIENSIRYLYNYDPDRFSKPFAYFTQVMKQAFLRRIAEEGTQTYIKQKMLDGNSQFFSTQDGDSGSYSNTYVDFIRDVKSDVVKDFEEKKRAKKEKAIKRTRKKDEDPGIDRFMVPIAEPSEEAYADI